MAAVTGALAEATPATRERRESAPTFSAGGQSGSRMERRRGNAFIDVGCDPPLRLGDGRRKTGPNNPAQLGAGFQFARGSP